MRDIYHNIITGSHGNRPKTGIFNSIVFHQISTFESQFPTIFIIVCDVAILPSVTVEGTIFDSYPWTLLWVRILKKHTKLATYVKDKMTSSVNLFRSTLSRISHKSSKHNLHFEISNRTVYHYWVNHSVFCWWKENKLSLYYWISDVRDD